jgi:hypothetical protein
MLSLLVRSYLHSRTKCFDAKQNLIFANETNAYFFVSTHSMCSSLVGTTTLAYGFFFPRVLKGLGVIEDGLLCRCMTSRIPMHCILKTYIDFIRRPLILCRELNVLPNIM